MMERMWQIAAGSALVITGVAFINMLTWLLKAT